MRIARSRRAGGVMINMTPLIDVTFLLIIFFLVSSHLARQEVQAQVDLPAAKSGQAERESEKSRVTVNVVATEQGGYEVRLGALPVDTVELTRRLSDERGRGGQDLEVRIRADRRVPYQEVEPILLAAAESGIWNVTFAVIRPEDFER